MRKMNPFIYFSQQKRAAVKAEVEASIDAEATPQERNREVLARIAGKNGWSDPHNGGTYELTSSVGDVVAASA